MRERESAFYGGIWGFLGADNHPHELTTNQTVAGSSHAERAPLIPVFAGVFPTASPPTPPTLPI